MIGNTADEKSNKRAVSDVKMKGNGTLNEKDERKENL